MTANIIAEYYVVEIDLANVTKMLLLHYVVEIYAGDTFAFADMVVLSIQYVFAEGIINPKQSPVFGHEAP